MLYLKQMAWHSYRPFKVGVLQQDVSLPCFTTCHTRITEVLRWFWISDSLLILLIQSSRVYLKLVWFHNTDFTEQNNYWRQTSQTIPCSLTNCVIVCHQIYFPHSNAGSKIWPADVAIFHYVRCFETVNHFQHRKLWFLHHYIFAMYFTLLELLMCPVLHANESSSSSSSMFYSCCHPFCCIAVSFCFSLFLAFIINPSDLNLFDQYQKFEQPS